ncbi:hypothetical protein GCM10010984_09980 [Chishuiella changwenlii]|nr:hypothetical protein [Chishuiella changwenlii]GGE94393.1 hypothetical protein GCM10010984_09980 [Chishuiella changwenlii]
MPVYFGCETLKDNPALIKCLNENLNRDVQSQIAFFSNIADYLQIEEAQSKLTFTIDKDGKFADLSADGENPIFNSVALSSVILLQNKMDRANVKIQPATNDKNEAIKTSMKLPLRYEATDLDSNFDTFPSFDRVLFTLKTDDDMIEIRIDKNFNFKTYGKKNDREYYLGKFSNLFEMASFEPYATAFENAFKTGLIDITKGDVDGKEYRLQIKNFFENDPNSGVLITVVREENGTWAEYYEYKTKKEFNQSKFAKLTYR